MPNAFSPLARNLKPKKKGRNFRSCEKIKQPGRAGKLRRANFDFLPPHVIGAAANTP